MPVSSYSYASEAEYELARDMDRLRGRLAGWIEILALPDQQERSAIALMKSLTYAAQEKAAAAIKKTAS